MAKASGTAEPSMEEILASIRRIISDETPPAEVPAPVKAPPPAPPAPPAPVPVAAVVDAAPAGGNFSQDDLDKLFASGDDAPDEAGSAADEVLELPATAMVAEEAPLELVEGFMPEEADVQFVDATVAAEPDWSEPEPEPAPPPPPPPPPRPAAKAAAKTPPPPPPPVDDHMEEAFEEPLVSHQAGASVNAAFGQLTHTILSAKAKTLDDLVKEMLRPMLKSWLDENLPVIVERLVRAEIERVSRGR